MANGQPAWTVTAQREDWQVVGNTGQAVQGMLITFQTASGAVGSVFVPNDRYTVETVRTMVNDRARIVESVQSLQG